MDQFSKLGPVQAFTKFWGTLSNTQRFVTAVFIATSVVLLVVVSVVATRPGMTVLFSGLQPSDSGAIVAKLQESKIPYQVEGTAIKVPAKNVYETRMQLASQGLPAGGNVGFEIFDKNTLGMTEFSQRLSYQRALQGELSRTIDQIDAVAQSRVHLAIPEEKLFADDKKYPTASVVLKLKAGGKLNGDQVAGIVRLVSSAVEGMDPNHVTVVDTEGNMLSEPADEATGLDPRMSSSQLRLKNEYEQQVQQDIQSMLERVLGPNRAVVRVSAKINFDRKETDNETYQPIDTNKGVLLSEDRTEESYTGSGRSVGGVVGVRSNINASGTQAATITPTPGNGYQRIETSAKYEVSKTTEHVVTAPGQVEKMSVAVMVDGKVDGAQMNSIQNAVSAAAGIEPERGDKVTVESMAFDTTAAKKEAREMQAYESQATYLSVGKSVIGILLLFGFLFFLKTMLKQVKIQVSEPAAAVEGLQQTPINPASIPVQGYDSTSSVPMMSGLSESGQPTQTKPQDVAKALRTWMSE